MDRVDEQLLSLSLLMAYMAKNSKRLMEARVLNRLDAKEGATAFRAVGHQ